jgi:hypothetical protein
MPVKKKSRVLSRGSSQASTSGKVARPKGSHAASRHAHATQAAVVRRASSRNKNELWLAPKTSLSRPDDPVASWSLYPQPPRDARLLELADIALGLRKPNTFNKRKSLFFAEQNAKRSN